MRDTVPPFRGKKAQALETFFFKVGERRLKGEISSNCLQLIISEVPEKENLIINASSPITSAFASNDGSTVVCLHGENRPAEFFCTKTGKSLSPQHFQKNG
jgi:hypothetical protein